MLEYKGYTGRVEFDGDAGVLHGEVENLRDVVTFEATSVEALRKAFRESVDDYLAMCEERGEEPEKPYSGKFILRVDPELHRDVANAAARSSKSINTWATDVFRESVGRSGAGKFMSGKLAVPPRGKTQPGKGRATKQAGKRTKTKGK